MATLKAKDKSACKYDLVSLGEVMLRFDPGEGRIATTREFKVYEGGGEYNVARGLRKCFQYQTAIVTGIVDNELGRLVEDLILQGGVDTSHIKWAAFDGIGRSVRNGLNFTERGYGVRGAVGVSDRANSAASQLKPGDVDWDQLFGRDGVRWLHTGGIFAALSTTSAAIALEAAKAAKKHGTIVSYDLNYRPSLWKANGGEAAAQKVNQELASYVDVMFGNEEDFIAALGISVGGAEPDFSGIDLQHHESVLKATAAKYPNMSVIAETLRHVHSASDNDWSAIAFADDKVHHSNSYPHLEILDRIGGGDSFASGFIYGMLEFGDPAIAINYGVAHGALAMTTPGDTSMATLKEVKNMVAGGNARVSR